MNAVQILTSKNTLTIGDLYNPLMEYALKNQKKESKKHIKAILFYYKKFKNGKGKTDKELHEIISKNIDYYSQYFSKDETKTIKIFYGLEPGFIDLNGVKHKEDLTMDEIFQLGFKAGEAIKNKIGKSIKNEIGEAIKNKTK